MLLNPDYNVLYTNNRIKMENTSKRSHLRSDNVSTLGVEAQKRACQILKMAEIFTSFLTFSHFPLFRQI